MGNLKPGATYIYEHADGITYAREEGADPISRFEIGRSPGRKELDEYHKWIEIRRAGKTNPTLQKAIDRVILIYDTINENVR